MSRTYAEDTKVPVDKSQTEVKKMLRSMGADRLAVFETPEGNSIVFELSETMYKVTQPVPDEGRGTREQREKAAWRALVLLIKAKKVAIEQGITTVEKEFMADTVMPDGSTLLDHRTAII